MDHLPEEGLMSRPQKEGLQLSDETLEDKQRHSWWFLVVKTSPSDVGRVGLIPGRGTKILHITWPRHQTIKQKPCCNKFKEDLKTVHNRKKKKEKEKT